MTFHLRGRTPHASYAAQGARAALALLVTTALSAACEQAETPSGQQHGEYTCPQPIGVIVRDDCARTTSKFDTLKSGAASGMQDYRGAVLREVDATALGLKVQAESLCSNFNTCKLTREEYLRDQQRLDTGFTELLNVKASVATMDAATASMVSQQVRDLRKPPSAATAPPAAAQQVAGAAVPAPRAPEATTAAPPSAEWRPGKFMIQAVAGVADAANKLGADTSWGYDIDGSAIMGAYLKTATPISMIVTYEAGREYALLGQGSEGTIDLDMAVKSVATGQTIKSDVDTDDHPVVHFFVPQTGQYEVVVQLDSARGPGAFVAVASMHKGGYGVPADNVIASLSRAVRASTRANEKLGPLAFHESGNWSLQATVLKKGEAASYGNILLETGSTLFLATADDHADDIDLNVTDSTTSQAYADTDNDANPMVMVPSNRASHRHSVKLTNAASRGPSFVTMMVLDKRN